MPLLPRKNIQDLEPAVHGGFDYGELSELGIAPDEIIDFSVSTNPAGILPGITRKITGGDIEKYPDSQSGTLRKIIAEKTGVEENNILVCGGSTEIIRLAALVYLEAGDKVLIPEPTYGEYSLACRIAGTGVITETSAPENDFRPDINLLAEKIKNEKPKAVFLCNPNNPSGCYLGREDFESILSASDETLVVMDEAYISFVERAWPSTDYIDRKNLLVVRSMTKNYALAGIRLAYAAACGEIIGALSKVCPPWNVNAAAQKIGIDILQREGDYIEKSREKANRGKLFLVKELEKLGFRCIRSDANFFLVEAGDAAGLRSRLLKKGILVRDCTSFGLPGYIRIAPRKQEQNRKLIAAMKELIDEQSG